MNARRVSALRLEGFIARLLEGSGVAAAQARSVARNMAWSDAVGRSNFGLLRLPIHVERVERGLVNGDARPRLDRLSPSTARLDADNAFGQFAGEIAMEGAVELARETGIGAVGVVNSNFYGTGAYFTDLAARAGMASLALSNSFPKVAAHGGLTAVLGTNPFAFGCPRRDGGPVLVDFATSSLAGSTVREHLAKGKLLPEGLAVLPDGTPLRDPARIGEGALLPVGGPKGFGLALMVEILAGVLTGAGFSHGVNSMYTNFADRSDSGHFMVAIDIARFMPLDAFGERIEGLVALLKASNPHAEVLIPGEARERMLARSGTRGIDIPAAVRAEIALLAARSGVPLPWDEGEARTAPAVPEAAR